jgi:hypothetical protein
VRVDIGFFNAVVSYISKRPYDEVSNFMDALKSGNFVKIDKDEIDDTKAVAGSD